MSAPAAPFSAASRAFSRLSPFWFVPLAAALLFLRKPWALHTPQLYAEDGSVFLVQDLHLGVSAWWTQYNGYLHLLPRLIAWLARVTADPAWWPAIYNGLAFAITLALFARLASARVDLPAAAKPWLMLAFALVASSGEVLINVTNLQWLTAFFLLLHLFTLAPTSLAQRLSDLAILFVVGLNGPFAPVFLPLFLWRAWSSRNRDTLLALLVVALCATLQLTCFAHYARALSIDGTQPPFQPLPFLAVLGSRLVTWPLFGATAARAAPIWLHAGAVFALIAFLAYSLRHDALRRLRALLVAAFFLITLASAVRVRADTLSPSDLINGDRYFFIPRLLLAWLLILQFHASRRTLAFGARALAVLAVATHAPRFVLPAPPDYRWADHCDPIRRAEAAHIKTLPEGWFIEFPGGLRKP